MALFFYNLFLTMGLIVFAPLLFVKIILTPRYRGRIGRRLGFALGPAPMGGAPRIWVHALSVGEVASARALVRGLRLAYPEGTILFSATTRSGEALARESLGTSVDCFVPFPLDLRWSVRRLLSWVNPDIFLLVETDFWPNFSVELARRGIPALLVNGRVSEKSLAGYRRFHRLFVPLFNSFQTMAMQSEEDAVAMRGLGVAQERLVVLGNLKYDAALDGGAARALSREELGIPARALVWVAGSTHPGEEEIILAVFTRLKERFPDLFLVLAPRKVERGTELIAMAARHGLAAVRRSVGGGAGASLLILDTLGELASVYALAEVAFVGGSLVAERGHNPLEPACHGKPVLFGPHMEDFAEISRDLLRGGGARQVADAAGLEAGLVFFLADPEARERAGRQGLALVAARRGVSEAHLALIRDALAGRGGALLKKTTMSSPWYFVFGWPFSPGYALSMRLRAWLYRKEIFFYPQKMAVPVVSVGNLTMGGTGKTPMVRFVSGLLQGMGRRPAIVSRGYGGKAGGKVNVVSDGAKILLLPEEAGDEPYMLARSLPGTPVLTGGRRVPVAARAIREFGADCIVMDDGFQHLALKRDLDLVLFSANSLMGNGRVFPGGPLREPLSALARAHAFVITGLDADNRDRVEEFSRRLNGVFPAIPVFGGQYRPSGVLDGRSGETRDFAELKGMRLFAFAGIANPASFRRTLAQEGIPLAGFRGFSDHHPYSSEDLKALVAEARACGAEALLTTEKDLVKLVRFGGDFPIMALLIELEMEDGFASFVSGRLFA